MLILFLFPALSTMSGHSVQSMFTKQIRKNEEKGGLEEIKKGGRKEKGKEQLFKAGSFGYSKIELLF